MEGFYVFLSYVIQDALYMDRIVIDRRVLGGKPVIKGTRISVDFVLDLLSSGMTVEDVVKEYAHLTRDDVLAALRYAANSVKHEDVIPLTV